MATKPIGYSRRYFYRLVLLLLVIVPFIPEIVICATAAFASHVGCQPDQKDPCLIGAVPASDVIGWALQAKVGFIVPRAGDLKWLIGLHLAVTLWLAACYVVLMQGWTRVSSRLLLGFGVALIFAVLPYFGSLLAIADLENAGCRLSTGKGGGACRIFGGYVGEPDNSPAYAAGPMGGLILYGAPLALITFAVYAVVVNIAGARAARRAVASA